MLSNLLVDQCQQEQVYINLWTKLFQIIKVYWLIYRNLKNEGQIGLKKNCSSNFQGNADAAGLGNTLRNACLRKKARAELHSIEV